MTRKRYIGLARVLFRELNAIGGTNTKFDERNFVILPSGKICGSGKYVVKDGFVIRSYQGLWDMFRETLGRDERLPVLKIEK